MTRLVALMLALLMSMWATAPADAATVGDRVASRSEEGRAHYEARRYDEALRAYQDALVERPESAALHLNVGAAMYQLGEHDKALEEFGRAAASTDPDIAARGYYNKGNTHFQLQDFGAAIDAYKQALERNPADVDSKANLELALRLMQQPPPQSQQGKSEDSDEGDEGEEGESGESEPQDSQAQQQPPQQQPGSPQDDKSQEDGTDEQPPASQQQPAPPSEPDAGEDESEQAGDSQPAEDTPEEMDEKEAEQLLDALNDRDEQSQKRRYRARRRSDDTQDW